MARFSTGCGVFSRRLARIENQKCAAELPKALMNYGLYGIVPEVDGIRQKIRQILTATQFMIETLPQMPKQ